MKCTCKKSVQNHCGEFVGKGENREFFLVVTIFRLAGIKCSIPFVVKACPETSI